MDAKHAVMPDRDDESGKYTESYTDDQFIQAIHSLGGAAGTSEVADELDCPYRTAHHRLTELKESGRVNSRTVGNSLLWQVAGDE